MITLTGLCSCIKHCQIKKICIVNVTTVKLVIWSMTQVEQFWNFLKKNSLKRLINNFEHNNFDGI